MIGQLKHSCCTLYDSMCSFMGKLAIQNAILTGGTGKPFICG